MWRQGDAAHAQYGVFRMWRVTCVPRSDPMTGLLLDSNEQLEAYSDGIDGTLSSSENEDTESTLDLVVNAGPVEETNIAVDLEWNTAPVALTGSHAAPNPVLSTNDVELTLVPPLSPADPGAGQLVKDNTEELEHAMFSED